MRCDLAVGAAATLRSDPPLPMSAPNASPARRPFTWYEAAAVALLLSLHAWLAFTSTLGECTTADEIAHLTAGRAYWTYGDYRLQPENGNLPQRWVGLPAWLEHRPFPGPRAAGWRTSDVWTVGHAYFYTTPGAAGAILAEGRAMNLLWTLATAALVFAWSRSLFGTSGGLVSLGFYVFCPDMLGNGALAASDLCMTFFYLASVGAFWRFLRKPGAATLALSCVVFGLACVAKYSAALLPGVFVLLALLRLAGPGIGERRGLRGAGRALGALLLHAIVAWAVIWLFFGFRNATASPLLPPMEHYYRPWEVIHAELGGLGLLLDHIRAWKVLPDAYVYGFAFVIDMSRERGAFLNGHTSLTGWPWFFPYAYVVKTPIAFLVALALTACLGVRRWVGTAAGTVRRTLLRADLQVAAPLAVAFAVYGAASVTSHLNIGIRHIFPLYPILFIAAGALGAWAVASGRLVRAVVALLVAGQAVASLSVAPHYLAFFNTLAGGPANGYRHLVDSSLDWGQDLPGLARWLDSDPGVRSGERVYVSYFGTGYPPYYGIRARALPCIPQQPGFGTWSPLRGGVYCVSATMLQQVYSPVGRTWTLADEREYQMLRRLEPALYAYAAAPAEKRSEIERKAPAALWQRAWQRFSLLRFARLCAYLRARTPDAEIGYSILIYRLTDADVAAAVSGPWSAWESAIRSASGMRDGSPH